MFRLSPKVIILILVGFVTISFSQNKVFTSLNLFDLRTVVETAISPDKNFIAYILNVPRPLTDSPGSDYRHLYLLNLLNGTSRGLITEKGTLSSIGWTNDSKYITLLAKLGDEKNNQVFKIDISNGASYKITNSPKSITKYELNSNNTKLAYTSTEPQIPRKKELLDRGFDAEIFEEEYLDLNLYVLDLTNQELRKITSNVSIFDFKWKPDGTEIAAAVADKNLEDYNQMFKRLYLIDPNTGAKNKIVDNPGKLADFEWSPDGRHLAFVASSHLNDAVSGSLFIVEIPNRKTFVELKNYSNNFMGSVKNVSWKNNNSVLFSAEEGVDITLSEQEINTSDRKLLLEPGRVSFNNLDFGDGLISFAGSTSEHPAEVFTFEISKRELIKRTENNSWLTGIKLGQQKKITYQAKDGLEIEAVLIYPVNYNANKKYPLIVYAHGGPETAVQNEWVTSYNSWGQIAAGQDYFVFMPNYRASSGRGVDFTMMGFGDIGGKEFDDVLDGIDYLIKEGFVDKNKVGIGGGSYGGYFAAWSATKHSDRFAASVVFVGIANQISKRNTTDIPFESYYVHWGFWTNEKSDFVYDRSPVKYAGNSKTPTLILHGKEDTRVHPSQALELYRALKTQGKAPVRLVLYPGQGHGNSKNTSKLDYSLRSMEWFDYYLKSESPKDKMPDKYLELEMK